MRRARAAYGRVEFQPRVLQDVSHIDLSTSILGRPTSLPFVLGPIGFMRMMHADGESAVARVATRAGIPNALSTLGTTSIEAMAGAAPDGRRWFQLYLWRDRGASRDFVQRAQEAGYEALVLTVDTPIAGPRLRDVRNGLTLPPSLAFKTFTEGVLHPAWWFDLLTTAPLEFASMAHFDGTVADLTALIADPTATAVDVTWLRENWPGKLIIKGVQTVADSVKVVDLGADAVVISNHGGRQLDRAPVPLELVPPVVEAIGHRAEVFVDGGIRSGGDVVAALAFGARAALIGRAYLFGLMAGGERGVQRAVDILTTEITQTMTLLGTTSVADLRPEHVRLR